MIRTQALESSRSRSLILLLLLTTGMVLLQENAAAQAMAAQDTRPVKPGAEEVERSITSLLLCEWPTGRPDNPDVAEFQRTIHALRHGPPAEGIIPPTRTESDGLLPGRYRAFGFRFDRIQITGVQGSGSVIGWSASASRDQLVAALTTRGHSFAQTEGPLPALESTKATAGSVVHMLVTKDRYSIMGFEENGGTTTMCFIEPAGNTIRN